LLFLVFHVGHDRYVLDAAQVIEVLPLVVFKRIPLSPPGVVGAFAYHGAPVPAIDLSQVMVGRASRHRLSTRIVLVRYPDVRGALHPLGLIAERVTTTLRREPADFVSSGVASEGAPYLGPVASDEHGLVQWIEVGNLLPGTVRDALFRCSAADGESAAASGMT
jgi:chemotaxis-related protein WspB